ncbi:MAG: SpoIIE family protein phosphatase [Acidobacteriaceae bacterium]|nr:SpoIIE family protein phosphatase [Acidobacteriaceae bacterium]MBV9778967.1 SpoIIE family protein phosphatase [Acidobacteriaceae bacterium]
MLVFILLSMGYYVAGAIALYQEWFHPSWYARVPVDIDDDTQKIVGVQTEAKSAGISQGDVIKALNGEAFTGDRQLLRDVRQRHPGETLAATVKTTNGITKTASIRLASREGPPWIPTIIALFVTILVLPALSLVIGYWVVAAKPRDPNAWLVLVVLAFSETFFGNLDWRFWGDPWFELFGVWAVLLQKLGFPALFLFGLYFPERWRVDRQWPWIKWLIVIPQLVGISVELWVDYVQFFHATWGRLFMPLETPFDWVFKILQPASIVLYWIALFDKLRSASTADARRRLRVLVAGSALSLGPLLVLFGLLPFFGFDPHHGSSYEIIVPFFAIFPLTLAYVVVVQRAMDLRILLRMGTKYALARGSLWLLRAGVIVLLIFLFTNWSLASRFAIAVRITALAALVFLIRHPLFRNASQWVDRKFFREAYNTEIVLSELSERARQFTEKEPLIETVTRRISETLHVPQIAVWLRGSQVFQLQEALGFSMIQPILLTETSSTVRTLTEANHPLTLYRENPDEWFVEAQPDEKQMLSQINAEVLLPFPGHDRLMGIMALGPKKSEEPYSPSDLRLLQSVATQTGLALEVSELAHSLAAEAAQRERIHREIEIAREVQERLFPQELPAINGIDLAGHCRPAQVVGGDYYDFIALEGARLGLAIGDISGKGISAALLMASLRASLRGMTLYGSNDLAELMRKVNQLVYEASASNRYATFFFAVYDPKTRELRYVNAGHNPPFLLRGNEADASQALRLEAGGPVIGLLQSAPYVEASLSLRSADLLLAYTDGISEAMTVDDEEWGEERMVSAVSGVRSSSAGEILSAIFRAADEFTSGAPQHDDMTLLIMKILSDGESQNKN